MDAEARKTALRSLETGLYLVGCSDGETPNVFLASWLTQCSFEPPLVMLGLKQGTLSHKLIKEGEGFVVNVPAADQKDMVQKFFKHADPEGDTIHGERFRLAPGTGGPILEAVPTWFEATVVHWYEGGDHDVVVAQVIDAGVQRDEKFETLTEANTGWNYGG